MYLHSNQATIQESKSLFSLVIKLGPMTTKLIMNVSLIKLSRMLTQIRNRMATIRLSSIITTNIFQQRSLVNSQLKENLGFQNSISTPANQNGSILIIKAQSYQIKQIYFSLEAFKNTPTQHQSKRNISSKKTSQVVNFLKFMSVLGVI